MALTLKLGWSSPVCQGTLSDAALEKMSIAEGFLHVVQDCLFRHLSAFNHAGKKLEHK